MAETGPRRHHPWGTASHHEKSLGFQTTKFMSLLQEAKDAVLDLKLPGTLAMRQKRQGYDITNVLEGIGLMEKKSRKRIQWKGVGPGCNTSETTDEPMELKAEIKELQQQEQELDQRKVWVQHSIHPGRHAEQLLGLCDSRKHLQVLYWRNPPGHLGPIGHQPGGAHSRGPQWAEVPNPFEERQWPLRGAVLVNKEAWNSLSMAVTMPPPEDLLQSTPALCTPPLLPKPALAQTQEALRPSSPQLPVPAPCLCLYRSSEGPCDPTAELTVSGGPGAKNTDPGKLSSLLLGGTALDTRPLQSSAPPDSSSTSSSPGLNPSVSFEPIRADPTGVLELPRELSEIFDPTQECMSSELLPSEVLAPLLRLSPPPGD